MKALLISIADELICIHSTLIAILDELKELNNAK